MSRFRIFYLLGIMLLFLALMMLIASFWSLGEQGPDRMAFLKAILLTAGVGFFLFKLFSGATRKELSLVENFTLVALAWFVAGIFGALPFHYFGLFDGSFIDAYFEAVSGFTTTGATLLDDIENIPRGLLLWRALTQWLGGMGIIVLFLAILPRFGFRSMTMFKAELPGPIAERLVPRVVETARRLWFIYVVLNLSEIILLIICGLDFFDAPTHSFTTMPTGGFSTYTSSIAAFNNPAAEIVFTLFMFLAGANFVLYFRLIRGDFSIHRNPELCFYTAVTALAVILITADIYNLCEGEIFAALRLAAFQVVSIITTTGYATTNFDAWHHFSCVLLLGLMFIGVCGGSNGGAIKQVRVMLMLKFSIRELSNLVHPSAISSIKLGDQNLSEEVLRPIMGFGFLYFALTVFATLILNGLGLDFETSLSAVAATIGNVGPGLAGVGPLHTIPIRSFLPWAELCSPL